MVRPNKIIVILQQCFVSIVMAFNGCQESSREKEVYDILKDAGILNPRICVAPDSGLFVYLPTDEYYNCSRLVGGFHDLERYKGECEWFDLKDLKCCTRLKSIDIGTGILLNIEEILRMPQLECVSGTLVEVPENMDVAGKLNALAGLLKIVLTKKICLRYCDAITREDIFWLLPVKCFLICQTERRRPLSDVILDQ